MKRKKSSETPYETDIQTIEALEKLQQIIREGINRASNILEEAKKVEELKTLLAQHQVSCDALNTATVKLEETEQKIAEKRSQLEEYSASLTNLMQQVTRQRDELLNSIEESKQALVEITDRQGLKALKQELEKARNSLSAAQSQLQKSYSQNEAQITRVEQEFIRTDSLRLAINKLVEKNDSQIEQLTQLNGEIDSKVNTIQNLGDRVLSSIKEIGGKETLETLQKEQKNVLKALNQAQLTAKEVQIQVEQRCEKFENQLQYSAKELNQLAAQVENNKNQIFELFNQVEQRTNLILELPPALEQMRSEISDLTQQITSDRANINNIQVELEDLRNRADASVKAGFEQLQNQIFNAQAELRQQLINLEKKQQHLQKWLWGITFAIGLVIALAIALIRFQ